MWSGHRREANGIKPLNVTFAVSLNVVACLTEIHRIWLDAAVAGSLQITAPQSQAAHPSLCSQSRPPFSCRTRGACPGGEAQQRWAMSTSNKSLREALPPRHPPLPGPFLGSLHVGPTSLKSASSDRLLTARRSSPVAPLCPALHPLPPTKTIDD